MLRLISFTGIDKKTNISQLVALTDQYPNIEFGFLVSASATNKNTNNRYPDLIVLQQLKGKGLNLALHVCGKLARDVAKTGSLEGVKAFMGKYFDLFSRIQLNIVGMTLKNPITDTLGKEVIIQTNFDVEESKQNYALMNGKDNIVFLSDKSGGHGEVTDFDFFDQYQGFAGGITPENILERKEEIDILSDHNYWLDMESGVRTDDWFDVNKVKQICQSIFKV